MSVFIFFFSSRRRHTRFDCDWSSDVCSSDLTDLLVAVGRAERAVNVKKGQWMSPEGMAGAVEKVRAGGAPEIAVTERGTFFGYGDLVVDMRNFTRLRAACRVPVVYDATHSVQQPGQGPDGASGGLRDFIPPLLYAAAAAGADRSEEHTSELQSQSNLVCRLLLEKKTT